jgi:hypothetical protein
LSAGRIYRRDWIRKFESTPSFINRSSSDAGTAKRIAGLESDIASVDPHTGLVGAPEHVELTANGIDRARHPIDNWSRIKN